MSTAPHEPGLSTVAARVTARALAHRYSRGRGLEAIDFTLESPGVNAVCGANGAGKSTLLRIVAGLLRPTSGSSEVQVAGLAVAPALRRHVIGYAGPDLAFYDELTVEENLRFAAEARGLTGSTALVDSALERVGLDSRRRDRADALSSGMSQRLRLAFALLHAPPLLLLDEPGNHLDEEGRATLERVVRDEGRRALVLIATNEERERALASHIIELRGRGLGHPA
ncbi:MAG: ATP-binding cassette domain-containing protein [Candidatus Eisenbacteria bacterium]|uniref:ATP-binding cassette domain-containing protein n=1 Tax=Eiseniibacteriota bacterium TaxID=2212470 RepID=A0A849SKC6_UNCEI|nr:ATP-binding cassette domain-containing protein [Candidatus Eisenbacteria bacterium]